MIGLTDFQLLEMVHTEAAIPGNSIGFERRGGRFISYKTGVVLAILFLAILLLVFFLGRFSTENLGKVTDDSSVLLPALDPLHYTLKLTFSFNTTANIEQFLFSGQVDIILRVREKTNRIQLHSRKLDILPEHTLLRRVSDEDEQINFENMMEVELLQSVIMWKAVIKNKINIYEQQLKRMDEEFVIQPAEPLEEGLVYLLSLQFKGTIEEEAVGLYRTKYIDNDNESRWIIASQFEPNNARQLFPCFDELDRKALFSITLFVPQDYRAFSNMAIRNSYTNYESNTQIIEFNVSPRLPPYLVSIVLTDGFVTTAPFNKQNVWTRPAVVSKTGHVKVIIPKLITFFKTLLNNNLPLDKIDFVGIPDYLSRGLESFGLVALEENMLLYTIQNSSLKQIESVSLHIGFHIIQQWFSNMVTPRSWSTLWLREAFAKYLSYHGLNEAGGQDNLSNIFLVNEMQKSMHADAYRDAQPLYQMDFRKAKDIRLLNPDLVYRKGGCLIRMLDHFVGKINFKHGLREYIKKWYLKSVRPSDVWDSFDESIQKLKMYDFNVSVREVMQSWAHNKGYPLVTVQINRKAGVITFTQKPFSTFAEVSLQEWYIPISYTTKEMMEFNSTKPKFWLTSSKPVRIPFNKSIAMNTWVIANIDQTGYYRVNYDIITWEILLTQLKENFFSIPVLSRYQLLDDAFALAHGGHIHYTIPLDLSSLFGQFEKELIPWQGLLKHIEFMNSIFESAESKLIYKQYVVKLLKRMYEEATKNKNEPNTQGPENEYLLYLLTEPMCRLDTQSCVQWARKHFRKTVDYGGTHKILHGDLRGTAYSVVADQDKTEDWLILWNKIRDPSIYTSEKYYLAQGLASTPNVTIIEELLTQISKINDSVITKNIKVEIWIQLGRRMSNLDTFLSFLRKFWESLYLQLQNHPDLLHKLMEGVGQQLGTAAHSKSVHDLKNYHFSICEQEDKSLFDHLIEEINFKISLRESHLQELLAWMNKYITT